MKQSPSIKKDSEFRMIYKNGTSYTNRLLAMYATKTGKDENRIDISVSEKVGNSVIRHHTTEFLRKVFRLNNNRIKAGLNIILIARGAARQSDYRHSEGVYLHLCGPYHVLKESRWGDYGKISGFVGKGIPEVPVVPQSKSSLYLHTYILPVRH